MKCHMCHQDNKLIEAHIYPNSWYPDGEQLKRLSSDPDEFPKRIPKGRYDAHIICGSCDSSFGNDETYTGNIFGKFIFGNDIGIPHSPDERFRLLSDVSTEKIYRTWLFLLWKMHHSTLDEYKDFSLGDHLSPLNESLQSSIDDWVINYFSINVLYYHDYDPKASMFGPPLRSSMDLNQYTIEFTYLPIGRCIVLIKTDKKPWINSFSESLFKNDSGVLLPIGFQQSGMFDKMFNVVTRNLGAFKKKGDKE